MTDRGHIVDAKALAWVRASGKVALLSTALVASVVLVGWWSGLSALTTLGGVTTSMKANSALALLLLSVGCWRQDRPQWGRWWCGLGGAAAVGLGAVSLLESWRAMHLGVDQLVSRDLWTETGAAGRMSAPTALGLVILGLAAIGPRRHGRTHHWNNGLAVLAMGLSYLMVLSHLLAARSLHSSANLGSIGLHTALALGALGWAILARDAEEGWLTVIVSESAAGAAARRLLPLLVFGVPVLAWIQLSGQRAGHYGPEFGIAMLAMANVTVLLGLWYRNLRFGLREELRRQALTQALAEGEQRQRSIARIATLTESLLDPVIAVDCAGAVLNMNAAVHRIFGTTPTRPPAHLAQLLEASDLTVIEQRLVEGPPSSTAMQARGRRRDGTLFPCAVTLTRWLDEGAVRFTIVIRDRTEEVAAEQALRASEAKHRTFSEHLPVGMVETDAAGECLYVNAKWSEITGLPPDRAMGQGWKAAIHPDDRARVATRWVEAGSAGQVFRMDYRYCAPSGRVAWVEGRAIPIRDVAGQITGFLGTIVDVTERHDFQEALTRSEANFRHLIQHAPFGILVHRNGQVRYANPALDRLLGRSIAIGDDIKGLAQAHLDPLEQERLMTTLATSPSTIGDLTFLLHLKRSKDDSLAVEATRTSIIHDGAPASLVSLHDVSERERLQALRREVEASLRESLRAKDTRLKEIHHRIKNNLQVIASLLNLQAERITHPSSRQAFLDTRARIFAIAQLHEHLYRSHDVQRIDMGHYLRGLIEELRQTNRHLTGVRIESDVSGVHLSMDLAIPIGLIVTELVTNSLKHAFPGARAESGRITVKLDQRGAQGRLLVVDNGVGVPNLRPLEELNSIGMLIVTSLTEQLGGRVLLESGAGLKAEVEFPMPAPSLTTVSAAEVS